MTLDQVQKAMRVKYGPYSQNYHQLVDGIHRVEETLGALIRWLEGHGEKLDLNVGEDYMKMLKSNPQQRVE